jgi:hypothetical protein
MAEPNYMAYAQYMGARNPMAEGLNQLGSTLGDIQKNQMERENMKRRNSLADLQMQQGQMQLQQNQMQMQDAQAQQGAKQDVYGVTDPRAAYAAEMRARQQAERADRTMKHVEKIKAFKAMGATPQFLTEWTKSEMMQDPDMAKMAPFVSFIDETKMEITKPFKDGELRDPLNPSAFLPAGTYKVIAKASGDPRDPYRFDKIEPITGKEENQTIEQLTSKALKGDKHSQAVLDAMQGREIAKAKANRAIITSSGGGGRGGTGKAPSGYRWGADGNLEAIPGGPAAMKTQKEQLATESAVATLDETMGVIDKLANHPGRSAGTGLSSRIDPRNYVPGTDAKDFRLELESFDGKLFLANVSKMKGLGALSDAEGKKLTAAAGAIKPGMSDAAFLRNITEIKKGLERAKNRVMSGTVSQLSAYSNAPKTSGRFTVEEVK